MATTTKIQHPIIESYVKDFIHKQEISNSKAKDQHKIFEQYINDLILSIYGNDPNASYKDMETGTAIGIDGIAIFVADKLVTNQSDVDFVTDGLKKFDVNFFFIQSKTTDKFDRTEIGDFFSAVRRFFDFEKCDIAELQNQWEIVKYLYSKSAKFKRQPLIYLKFITLAPDKINLKDIHMLATVEMGTTDLINMNYFNKELFMA